MKARRKNTQLKRYTLKQLNALYDLYSYMVDVAEGTFKYHPQIMDDLGRNAAKVVIAVLQRTDKDLDPPHKKTGKVIPMKRRTA